MDTDIDTDTVFQLEEIFLTQPWPARTSSLDLLCVVASASITRPSPKVQGT